LVLSRLNPSRYLLMAAATFMIIGVWRPVSARAQGLTLGKYENDFLAIGVGGRALGMGSAYTSIANDVTAGYWNPAGLSRIEYPEIMLMHDQRYADAVSFNYGAGAMSLSKTETVGISLIVLNVSGIPNTQGAGVDANGNPIPPTDDYTGGLSRINDSKVTFFSATDLALIGSYAKRAAPDFSYGANVKFIRRSLGSAYATGIGFDIGVMYTPFTNFNLGANLQNATTTVLAWTTGTTEVAPPTLATGASYTLNIGPLAATPALDLLFNANNLGASSTVHLGPLSADVRAGAELSYKNVVALRAGYDEVKQFTVGAGIHLPKLEIDYSFARFAYSGSLGDTHRISLELVLENGN
jgi:hypothetical protein